MEEEHEIQEMVLMAEDQRKTYLVEGGRARTPERTEKSRVVYRAGAKRAAERWTHCEDARCRRGWAVSEREEGKNNGGGSRQGVHFVGR